MPKNILIIGGSGFVGQNLVSYLLSKSYKVSLLNRGNHPIAGTKEFYANRENKDSMEKASKQIAEVDVVIDTSCFTEIHAKIAWDALSHKTKHWIQLSSSAVYKEKGGALINEKDPIGGAEIWGSYGVQKSKADSFLIKKAFEKPVTIFRPPYLYGPKDVENRANYIWGRCLNNQKVAVPGNGQTLIQFLHIYDLVGAVVVAIANPPEPVLGADIYNVASPETYTLVQWVETVAASIGKSNPAVITHNYQTPPRDYFPFRDYSCILETCSIQKKLGWKAKYNLPKGLKVTLETYNLDDLKTNAVNIGKEEEILSSYFNLNK